MKKLLLAVTCAATLLPSLTTPASAYVYYYRYHCWHPHYWHYHYWHPHCWHYHYWYRY